MSIPWDDGYCIGIPEIDHQHRRMFQLIGEVQEATRQATPDWKVRKVFLELYTYALNHFAAEEAYMRERSYPGYADHKADHDRFVQELNDMVANVLDTGDDALPAILEFLTRWLVDHILKTDMALKSL